MAYKRNPMRTERMCALARFVISLPMNEAITSSTQWFERTLDDSANKRITIAQAFLALDGVLNLYLNVSENMVVYEKTIKKRVQAELPFMATETILMECVKLGGDRQKLHEKLRVHSMAAAKRVKQEGKDNDLIERIKNDKDFSKISTKLNNILNATSFTGRASEQVVEFIENEIDPILKKHTKVLGIATEIKV